MNLVSEKRSACRLAVKVLFVQVQVINVWILHKHTLLLTTKELHHLLSLCCITPTHLSISLLEGTQPYGNIRRNAAPRLPAGSYIRPITNIYMQILKKIM